MVSHEKINEKWNTNYDFDIVYFINLSDISKKMIELFVIVLLMLYIIVYR